MKQANFEVATLAATLEENKRVVDHLKKEYYKIRKNPANIEFAAILSRLIKEVVRTK